MAKKRPLSPSPFAEHLLCASEFALLTQIFATAIVFNGYFTNPLVNKFILGQSLSLIAWILYFMHCFFARKITLVWSTYYIPAALLTVWVFIRSITSPDSMALWSFYVFSTTIIGFPLWVTFFQTKRFRSQYIKTVIVTGTIALFGSLWQFIWHLTHTYNGSVDIIPRWFQMITLTSGSYDRQFLGSFLGHNNHSMAYLVIVSVFALMMLYRSRRSFWFVVYAVILCTSFFIIIYGGSRSAFLMIPPAFLVMGYGIYRQSKYSKSSSKPVSLKSVYYTATGIAALILVVLLILTMTGDGRVSSVFSRFVEGKDYLLSGTYPRVWMLSLYMFAENPLTGIGFGSWAHQYPFYQESWFTAHPQTFIGLPEVGRHTEQAHNDYLMVMAELGLPGLFLMLWLLVIHFRNIWTYIHQSKISLVGITAVACTIATLVQTMFAFPFNVAPVACLFISNLALFAYFMSTKTFEFRPALLQIPSNPARWLLSGLAMLIGAATLYPSAVFTKGDYNANQKRNYFYAAYARLNDANVAAVNGNTEDYHENMNLYYFYYEHGMKFLESSFNYLPNRGLYLYNYGVEILGKGIQEKDEAILQQAIEYFEKSKGSYTYYDTFTHIGRAYRELWNLTQNDEYLSKAIENLHRAVSIMPTYQQGWINYTALLGEAGRNEEGIEILAETELRYPGTIEDGVYGVVEMATTEGNIERAALAFNIASTVTPHNPKLFERVIDFYLSINRLDMAKRMLAGIAPFQQPEDVYTQTLKVLLPLFNAKQYAEANDMMQQIIGSPSAQESAQLHYYAAVTAWLAGAHNESAILTQRAIELGVSSQQLQPLLQLSPELSVFPFNTEILQSENSG